MAPSMERINLGSILLIGGEGFLGSFIINDLLHDPSILYTSITVAGLKPSLPSSFPPSISYHNVNISDESAIRKLLASAQPRLIFHLASPLPGAPVKAFESCNIIGTEILLRCAEESQYVEALILTSSNQVLANTDRTTPLTEEAAELWNPTSKTDPYSRTKAIADSMVRNANSSRLKTVALRFPNVYGGTDAYMTIIMDFLRNGQHTIQLGEFSAMNEFIAVENAAHAHVLAAKHILDPATQSFIAGEAFFISDDEPDTFYGFARKCWAEAGHHKPAERIWKVPFWLLIALAWVFEWVVWIGTAGRKGVETLEFSVSNVEKLRRGQHRLDIGKARRVLGYERVVGREEGLRRAVERNVEAFGRV